MTTRILIGRPRFSADHGWGDLLPFFPSTLDVEVAAVELGVAESAILRGDQADVIVPFMSPVTASAIEFGKFGLIQQFGAGLDGIDMAAAIRAGVWVANMPGIGAVPVAEHAMALLLALYRRLSEASNGFIPGRWGEPATRSLAGSTACVVGLGAIGAEVSKRLRVFDVRVIGVRKQRRPDDGPNIVASEHLHQAVAVADCVVVTASHTAGNPPIIGPDIIAVMKQDAVLINISRGALVDTDAALAAVEIGRLGGMGLDVFPEEPYPASGPLMGHPRILATAHTAALTDVYFRDAAQRLSEAIQYYVRGEAPPNTVNSATVRRPEPRTT
jgi:phosphoglycerate dehydrogenase-like enzyme